MKLIENIFSSIFLFFKSQNDGRHGEEMPIIGAIFTLTLALTANVLSFFSAKTITETKWLYYLVVLIASSILIIYFYRKKRYLHIVNQFEREKNNGFYNLITFIYIVLSIVIFAITR